MIRVRFELLPGGDERRARTIGLMEICRLRMNADGTADYGCVLTKTPPFKGALRTAWRKGHFSDDDGVIASVIEGETDDAVISEVMGHHRTRRGVYDLAFRALAACGLGERVPLGQR